MQMIPCFNDGQHTTMCFITTIFVSYVCIMNIRIHGRLYVPFICKHCLWSVIHAKINTLRVSNTCLHSSYCHLRVSNCGVHSFYCHLHVSNCHFHSFYCHLHVSNCHFHSAYTHLRVSNDRLHSGLAIAIYFFPPLACIKAQYYSVYTDHTFFAGVSGFPPFMRWTWTILT